MFIHTRVAPAIQSTIRFYATAPEMWAALMQRYHRRDAYSLLRSLSGITNLHLSEDESIAEHVTAFNAAWFELSMRTGDAPPAVPGVQSSLETVLGAFAHSDRCKADVLIASLPIDLITLGWDLRDRHGAELHSHHVSRKLMDLHEMRDRHKALDAARAAEEEAEDCTWCRSRGYDSAGHGWRECGRLRNFQNKGKAKGCGRRA